MKILVTGASGFIGHNVVRFLESQGHECFGIDSRTDYGFIPWEELAYLMQERCRRIQALPHVIDIREAGKVMPFVGMFNIQAIVHLASFPRQKVVKQNPSVASEVMATGLINLLEAAARHKVKRFVYISSSMVYGDFENNVTEDAPCNPIGQYGIMKYMGEKLVEDYSRQFGFDYTIIRPSAVYGELDVEDRVVSKFILNAIREEPIVPRGPYEVLDFTHVDDVALGIAQATVSEAAKNKIYNLTRSGEPHTLLSAAQIAIQVAGGYGNIQPTARDADFPSRGLLNIDRARNDFGYNPTINVEEGFQRYHDWFKKSTYWKKLL
jgi:nucleoside-diphosphate-sugar epimerase